MNKVILVVEDDAATRQMMVDIFDGFNSEYQVVEAENGKRALEFIKKTKVNLITLDLEMPTMDGNTFLGRLSTVASEVPVIVISSNPKKLDKHYSQVKDTLSKPFDLKKFYGLLSKNGLSSRV